MRLTVLLVLLALMTGGGAAQAFEGSQYPLLYSRPVPDGYPNRYAAPVHVVMVGDVSLARGVARLAERTRPGYPLEIVAPLLRTADWVVGNGESAIAGREVDTRRPGALRLRAMPESAAILANAGFDMISLANNHSMDWGPSGLEATIRHLTEAKIAVVGAGENAAAAYQPVATDFGRKGQRIQPGVKIIWLAYTLVPDPPEPDRPESWTRAWLRQDDTEKLAEAVRRARALGTAVVVQFHWGSEYQFCPWKWQVDLAHAAIDAGASMVVGHHPHVLQNFETYHGGFIAYSLGNFLFDQDDRPGLALWARFDNHGLIDVRGLMLLASFRPVWYSPQGSAANLRVSCPAAGL